MALPDRLQDLPPGLARLCLRVEAFLREECGLAPAGTTLLVAFSGGLDSTALTAILHLLTPRLGIRLEAAHLDHGLRPESGAEAAAAAAFCRRLGLPCLVDKADVAGQAKSAGGGLEEAARRARYAFLETARQRSGAAWVVLAHQLDDLAEDQLLRLTRGAGWPALGGMPAVDGRRRLLRPLLLTPRLALREFLVACGLSWTEDPTNADPAFKRNRLRQDVLPRLVAENPRYLEAAARLWRQAALDASYLGQALGPVIPDADGEIRLPADTLNALHPALRLRLLKAALDALGPGESLTATLFAVEAAWREKRRGTTFLFPGKKRLRLTRQGALLGPAPPQARRRGPGAALTGVASKDNDADCEKSNLEGVSVNILTFGPNGSGKGTQGSLVKKKYNLAHIESGAIFREHIGGGTELGKKAKAYIDKGELVPDDITIPMILSTLKEKGKDGWLLDGFPRNMVQAEKLWEALKAAGMKLDYVIEILLPRQIAKDRIMGRRLCVNDPNHPNNIFIDAIKPNGDKCRVCGGELKTRSDDQDEGAIGKRHDIYYDTKTGTLAAAYFYKDLAAKGQTKYIELNGEGSIDSIKETLLAKLA